VLMDELWTANNHCCLAVVQFGCHPEQASVAPREIWACRFAPVRERHASAFKLHHYRWLVSGHGFSRVEERMAKSPPYLRLRVR
jgi:hypothetical protein